MVALTLGGAVPHDVLNVAVEKKLPQRCTPMILIGRECWVSVFGSIDIKIVIIFVAVRVISSIKFVVLIKLLKNVTVINPIVVFTSRLKVERVGKFSVIESLEVPNCHRVLNAGTAAVFAIGLVSITRKGIWINVCIVVMKRERGVLVHK